MRPLQTDLSIFNKFKFEKPPVGVKFLYFKPEGTQQLDKNLAFCEMIKEAQQRESPFYFAKENEDCFGTVSLGMEQMSSWGKGGEFGAALEIFQEPRANARIYQYVPKFPEGTVNYVAMSSLDKLTFDPDLLIIVATPAQAEIVLRAMSYSTGEIWESKTTGVLGCAWIFVYPYQSSKINYVPTGMTFWHTDIYPLGLDTGYNAKPEGNEMGPSLVHRWEGKVCEAERQLHCEINPKSCESLNLGRILTYMVPI
jgi:uncharacterized protein (DUF169 family)